MLSRFGGYFRWFKQMALFHIAIKKCIVLPGKHQLRWILERLRVNAVTTIALSTSPIKTAVHKYQVFWPQDKDFYVDIDVMKRSGGLKFACCNSRQKRPILNGGNLYLIDQVYLRVIHDVLLDSRSQMFCTIFINE